MPFVRPKFFKLQLATAAHFFESPKFHALVKTIRHVTMHFDSNFTTTALRLEHAGESNELVGYSRISSVNRL